ncbi:c-type cytochrome [Andreprevotia chitinilytica]|uniref:c-type cytochrome n=1 Tax=Andreprevotia chitinilytica TaxID=396808 RepID=UPI000A069F58|nr:cytochrome c [Andreprevotia chitinilytica]
MKKQLLIASGLVLVAATVVALNVESVEVMKPQLTEALGTEAKAKAAGTPAKIDQALIEKGAYVAKLGDCAACHTAPGGKPLAGGLGMGSPFGTIYSTNITPDPTFGIGNYTLADFKRAMREGKAKDGHNLYPAMPYPSFSKINDDDMAALYAYMMHGVAPVAEQPAQTALGFPFNQRWGISLWNTAFLPSGVYRPDDTKSVRWNRGAYLVQGLEHCGSCHTPRGIGAQEKSYSETDGKHFLGGAALDGWFAPALVGEQGSLRSWSEAEIVDYLKTGRSERTAVFGAMADVVAHSTQHLTDEDLGAMAAYLKSQTPASRPAYSVAALAATAASSPAAKALMAGDISARGAPEYLDNCSGCHRSSGNGAARTFPPLAGNSVVNTQDPTSLIHIVLTGSTMPATQKAPTPLAMPGFDWRLSDQQVADVVTFIRGSWGNNAPAVSSKEVAKVRKAVKASSPAVAAR